MQFRTIILALFCAFYAPPASPQPPAKLPSNVIEKIELQGLRHMSQDKLRARLKVKTGDVLNEMVLVRDLITLQTMGEFTEVNMFKQPGERGGTVVRFVLVERNVNQPVAVPKPPSRPQ